MIGHSKALLGLIAALGLVPAAGLATAAPSFSSISLLRDLLTLVAVAGGVAAGLLGLYMAKRDARLEKKIDDLSARFERTNLTDAIRASEKFATKEELEECTEDVKRDLLRIEAALTRAHERVDLNDRRLIRIESSRFGNGTNGERA